MARIAKPLTALEVGRLSKPGYQAVGTVAGLYLQVTEQGAKSWVLRVLVGSKRREIGLGAYPGITLAMAHQKAREARQAIEKGIDPVLKKKALASSLRAEQANEVTFKTAAMAYIKAQESGWKNAKHAAQWVTTLETYAFPVMGKLLVADIGVASVLAVLEPIWQTKTETASRLRGRIESVLDWATARGHRHGLNPARWKGHLDTMLVSPGKIKNEEHHPAVLVGEAGAFMRDLRSHDGIGARALEFVILTASRSGEVRGATWDEFDLDARLWTIPAGRMKAGVEHREPLSDIAVALLKALPKYVDSNVVFLSPRGNVLSDMTMSQLMRRMKYKARDGRIAVPHGMRRTFKAWAHEKTNAQTEVIEMALAHAVEDKTEAAYFDTDLLEKRRLLMAEWAIFLGNADFSDASAEPAGCGTA